ncbi:hypothetical protein [Enterobacter sp. UNJFSC 003]|uniref:hypothetical protein n=1 Tax=Enterobacter sp. UNJFSC 003 TaxID=3122077 RepID=UPI002EAEEF58|nr:hypothetical protein [Serratia liquefaciens]
MQKLSFITGLSLLLLVGCAQKAEERMVPPAPVVTQSQAAAPVPDSDRSHAGQTKRMQECRNELEAMQIYSKASYNKYNGEVQKLTVTINKYRKVQESIGSDINDIVMPQTEFQMRELCFRIKSHLMLLMLQH